MRSATFPPTDNVLALGDQIGGYPRISDRGKPREIGHERPDVFLPVARLMQRVFQQHIRCSDFVDYRQMERTTAGSGGRTEELSRPHQAQTPNLAS
jgi:hypothetical protein